MKYLSAMVVGGACLALTLQVPLTARPQAQEGNWASQAPQDRDAEFKQKFRQALEINAKDEIVKLVRSYNDQAMGHVIALCFLLSTGSNETIERELKALKEAWKTCYKSSFVDRMYEYFSLLEPRVAKDLEKLQREYDAAFKKYEANLSAKDAGVCDLLAGEFERIAKLYEEAGYQLFAARSYNLAGINVDTGMRGAQADLNRAADYYGASYKACETWELNDSWAIGVKARFEGLTREGKGSAAGTTPGNAPAPLTAEPIKVSAAVTSAMHFEAVPSFDTYVRPSYFLDDVAILWPVVFMREKGSTGGFAALDSKKVKMMRTGSAALTLDVDGDGKGDQPVPASGNHALVQCSIGEGADKREWAFVTEVGTDKEVYQGVQVNFGPNDQQFQLYVMSAASMVGTLNNVPVRVFDDNMDGIYGSPPKQWQYAGLPEGSVQSDIDSILVGTEKHARPWTQFGEIGGAWFEFEPQQGGLEIKATPATIETGKLKLEYKGEMPEYVILQGEGPFEKTCIDLLQNGGAEVSVPAGKYHLFFGLLRKGKKQQVTKALILPGKRTPSWVVKAGATTVVPLGGPFSFDFETEVKEGKLTVKGPSVTVIGAASERYERLWNCVPRPEFAWRKAGSKKASKPERMGIVEDLNAEDDTGKRLHEYTDTYHPLNTSVEVKLKEG
ncbi:MAG: hypothetical protein ABI054_02920, partial [Planctomycetota bacterium]